MQPKRAIPVFCPLDQKFVEKGKPYNVTWHGHPTAFKMFVAVAMAPPLDNKERIGITVRVRAFNDKGKVTGQINGPGSSDDTFLTGQKICTFTPSKPGMYRLTVEVLDEHKKVVPVAHFDSSYSSINSYTSLRMAQDMKLWVYQPPKPQMEVSYGDWRVSSGKTDLYERQIEVQWKNIENLDPYGHLDFSRDGILELRKLKLQLRVITPTPVRNLNNISWVSAVKVDAFDYRQTKVGVQYFRYDPVRDIPRNLNLYTVKAEVLP